MVLTYGMYPKGPIPGDPWYVNLQRPIVDPAGQARDWIDVLHEVAGRHGFRDDFSRPLNVVLGLTGDAGWIPSAVHLGTDSRPLAEVLLW